MKKIGLIFLVILICFQANAQKTVYGKYKGKSVKLVYFEGDPDIIKSIEYERVGDLEKENSNLQSQIALKNKKIADMQSTIGGPIVNKPQTDSLKYEIKKLQTDKDKLSAEIKNNNSEISKLKAGIQPFKDSLNQVKFDKVTLSLKVSELQTKNQNLTSQIAEKDKKIQQLQVGKGKSTELTVQIDTLNNQIEKLQKEKNKLLVDVKNNSLEITKLKTKLQPVKDSLSLAILDKTTLETKNKSLENQIVEKNKKIKELSGGTKGKPFENKEKTDSLNYEIKKLQTDKDKLSVEVKGNNAEIAKLKESKRPLNDSLDFANKKIKLLEDKLIGQTKDNYKSAPSLAVSYASGIPFLFSNIMKSGIWNKTHPLSNQFSLMYEQPLGTVSLGVGLGITNYKLKASFSNYQEIINGLTDADNDTYNAICSYKDVKEDVSLLYMDIPVALSFGQPRANRIGAYCKIGVTASINLHNKFNGEGKYNISGYYPKWEVQIHDVEELNFSSDASCYEKVDYKVNRFVLWGNLSGGVYLPLSNIKDGKEARYILKLGARCDYSFTPISKQLEELYKGANYRIKQSNILSGKGTRILSPGLEISFIFMLAKPQ